jgi:hypothetical protein
MSSMTSFWLVNSYMSTLPGRQGLHISILVLSKFRSVYSSTALMQSSLYQCTVCAVHHVYGALCVRCISRNYQLCTVQWQCRSMQRSTVQSSAMWYSEGQYSARAVKCSPVQINAAQHSTVQQSEDQCSAVWCSEVQCSAMQWPCCVMQPHLVSIVDTMCHGCTRAGPLHCPALCCTAMHCRCSSCAAPERLLCTAQ